MSDYLKSDECPNKPGAPVSAGVAVCVVGVTAPVLVGHELGLVGTWIAGAAGGFAAPALLLVLFRLGWLLSGDLLSPRVVRRTGQICLVTFLLGAALRALGLASLVADALGGAGLAWTPAAVALVVAGVGLVAVGSDLEKRRLGWFSILYLLVTVGLVIAVPNFRMARLRANQRACIANQMTIVGAIEMYNLDKNIKTDPRGSYMRFAQELRQGGYLRSTVDDPGQGANSGDHYVLTGKEGNGIRCTVHGSRSAPKPISWW